MSRLSKVMQITPTGKLVPAAIEKLADFLTINSECYVPHFTLSAIPQQEVCVVKAQFGVNVQTVLSDPVAKEMAMRGAKMAIIDAVFGEFRQYFRDIDLLLAQGRIKEAASALRSFEKQMFYE